MPGFESKNLLNLILIILSIPSFLFIIFSVYTGYIGIFLYISVGIIAILGLFQISYFAITADKD